MPRLDTSVVTSLCTRLPDYYLHHAPLSVAVATYRTLLGVAGRYPASPIPMPHYLDLLQRYADLLIHVLHDSPFYPPASSDTEQVQVPETALEEAILLLLLLQAERDTMSVSQVSLRHGIDAQILAISKLAYEAYSEARLFSEGVRVGLCETCEVVPGGDGAAPGTQRLPVVPDRAAGLSLPQPRPLPAGPAELSPGSDSYGCGWCESENTRGTRRTRRSSTPRWRCSSPLACVSGISGVWTTADSTPQCSLSPSFAALVLQKETKPHSVSQALLFTGLCALLQARGAPFFSQRKQYMVGDRLASHGDDGHPLPRTGRLLRHHSQSLHGVQPRAGSRRTG